MPYVEITPPTDILSPLVYANTITGQWFGGFILLFVFMVTFVGLKIYATEKGVLTAAIVSFIVAVLLVPTGIVSPIMISIPLVLMAVGLVIN